MTDPTDAPLIRPGTDEKSLAASDQLPTIGHLPNSELIARLKGLVKIESKATAWLIAHLAEFDRRRLYADLGYSSLFAYCTRELGYSEDAACKRINSARAVLRFPILLELLKEGRIHMAAVVTLAPHLTEDNHQELITQACGKSKRQVEALAVSLGPEIQQRESIRHVGPERVLFKFAGSEGLLTKIERARQLLRHKFPAGRLEDVFAEILNAYLVRKDPDRKLQNREPQTTGTTQNNRSRCIPQSVKNAVWKSDQGCCSYITEDGRRCEARNWLEFDHIVPWAIGGRSDRPENIRLLCRTHNQMMARKIFGEKAVKPRRAGLSAPGRICLTPNGEISG